MISLAVSITIHECDRQTAAYNSTALADSVARYKLNTILLFVTKKINIASVKLVLLNA